ncbi:MAG: TIGR00341 family protein, partial [Bacteroidetes bacterium 4572_117]
MENEAKKDKIQEKNRRAVISNIKSLIRITRKFLIEILSIKEGTDIQGTIESIKKDMVFRGITVWILIASIFIASIGLNVNSIPVVIGAMLISPLMGPILGIGLSVGTNDWDLLLRALKNFGIAIVISLITSIIYFLLTPLKEASPELIARTKPTILDVMIAIFGGMAGIVAGSRREKTNVIPGVAIATALMPPLCTAGYGIATGQFTVFFGAFYLFFINSVFIALST